MNRLLLRLSFLVLTGLFVLPTSSLAFDASVPGDVGLALFPFQADREEDRSVAFLLEDYLQANLPRAIRHPVYTGRELAPAVPAGAESCLQDPGCLRLLGGQFNVSLAATVQVFRSGSEIQLEVAFYTTGNGLLVGRENTAFQTGDERAMVDAFSGWFQLYFDSSLRVSASNRAGEGGLIDVRETEQERRAEDYHSGREKKVYSRRTDFGDDRDEEVTYDRTDPTADLRALVGDDDDDEPSNTRSGRRSSSRDDTYELSDEDEDLDEPEPRESRSSSDRSSRRSDSSSSRSSSRDREDVDLDADEDSGRSVSTHSDSQRAGYGQREYQRFTASGMTMAEYETRRWDVGGRFYLRAGAFYGGGWLTRRYSTVVFVRTGNVKSDEYMWERLGPSKFGNPGGGIGFGFALHKVVAIEADISMMFAQQDLRREYDGHEIGTNVGDVLPQTQPTSHLVVDVRGRFFLPPLGRFKFTTGVGVTAIVMQGFKIPEEPPLDYSSRPVAGVLGVTPLVGFVVNLSPFVALNVDGSGTIYLTQGAARYEQHDLFNGVTEPYLPDYDKQPPIDGVPLMGRLTVSTMIFF